MTPPYMGSVVPGDGAGQLLARVKGHAIDGPAVTHVLQQDMC